MACRHGAAVAEGAAAVWAGSAPGAEQGVSGDTPTAPPVGAWGVLAAWPGNLESPTRPIKETFLEAVHLICYFMGAE